MNKLVIIVCLLALSCADPAKAYKTPLPSNMVMVGESHFGACSTMMTYEDKDRKVICYGIWGCDGRLSLQCLKE